MSNEEDRAHSAPAHVERRLAAILHADVQGYSRLLGEDELATLGILTPSLAMMRTLVQQHGGRAVGSRGDSLLAEFPSVVAAVQCAVAMQQELKVRNAALPQTRRVEFRMGVNLGEIVVDGEQLHGDGINIAVRLEGIAEAGGICLSEVVYQQIKNKLVLAYEDVGQQTLKNIAEPVRVWRIIMDPEAVSPLGEAGSPKSQVQDPKSKTEALRRVGTAHRIWAVVGGLALIVGGIVTVRYLSRPPLSPQDSALSTAAQPGLPLPDKPSLVVLPFVNMNKDPEQDYFSDGLTETLTGDLSQISSLFVIARNSAFTYKGKAVKMQDVGREMGVRYVLEGSVLRADNQVRINAQLIDATTGYHLWSERYDRPLQNILTWKMRSYRRL
jgi:adenylate cyclase